MPLIHIKCANLPPDQKKRIGDRIIEAFHGEGFAPASVVVLFQREDSDILLDGGLLFEMGAAAAQAELPKAPPPVLQPVLEKAPAPNFKNKLRRSKIELTALKAQLVKTLQVQGALSSFQAQEELGLKTCEWAPATLRRFFSELEDEGVILKQGQKRGTRYVWRGITNQPTPAAMARLVKRADDETGATNN